MPADQSVTTVPHPLVIDRATKLARPATQDDIHRMEAICVAYDAVLREFAERLRLAGHLQSQLENTYRC
jgi:hypothetical protein